MQISMMGNYRLAIFHFSKYQVLSLSSHSDFRIRNIMTYMSNCRVSPIGFSFSMEKPITLVGLRLESLS